MVCPSEYKEFSTASNYCYRIFNEELYWDGAKQKCHEDGGELACFSNAQERDNLVNECKDQCWVGYIWKNSEYSIIQKIYMPLYIHFKAKLMTYYCNLQ